MDYSRKLLSGISNLDPLSIYPLYIVGVAEQSLFWKDVRRILFANARFRVLCRVGQTGIRDSWTPVKLAHILDLVKPGLGKQIDALGSVVLASMMNASTTDQKANAIQLANIALTRYGILLAEHYGKTLTKEDLSLVGLPSEYQCNSFGSFEERRTAFNDIADFVKSHLNLELEPLTVAQIRGIAMHEAGVDLLGRPLPAAADTPTAELSSRVKRFIDSEFVGVYW